MWSISDKNKTLELDDQVIAHFLDEETIKDPRYTLYAYADVRDGQLYIKFGETYVSCFDRYNSTGNISNRHMVCVWESLKGDKQIHSVLKRRSENKRGYKWDDTDALNSNEVYLIESLKGYYNLMADISEEANSTGVKEKTYREDYKSIVKLVDEIIDINTTEYNLDLCARWGKTSTTLRLCREYSRRDQIKMFFMCSYVGTVKHSYSDEILSFTQNDNCLFIDPDTYEDESVLKDDIDTWLLNDDHYIMFYVALTGDKDKFNSRIKALNKFNKKAVMFIEEADFGAHCDNQVAKIRKIRNKFDIKRVLSMTGTNADRCETIFSI